MSRGLERLREVALYYSNRFAEWQKELALRDTPEWTLHRYRVLLRPTMRIQKLSIDPRGTWSAVKARKVLEVINPEAERYGIVFRAIDVSTHNKPNQFLLVAFCMKHERQIAEDTVCVDCKRENPA